MNLVNESGVTIRLRDFMDAGDGWGHEQGRRVHNGLLKAIENRPEARVIRVSLEEVLRTDASFPRESVVELARRFRGQRGICVVDATNQDLLENWDAAATRLGQPLLSWNEDAWRLLGPQPSEGNRDAFELIMEEGSMTASAVSKKLAIKLTNASTKLKQLVETGFLLRQERASTTGGVEYVYCRIR